MIRLNKSNKDMDAADSLIKADFYAPSVHASYYGTFLFMKYIGNHCLSLSYSMQDDPEKGHISHDSLVLAIGNSDSKIQRLLRSKFGTIHMMRRTADYGHSNITKEQAEKVYQLSTDVRTELSTFYQIAL